MSLGYSQTFSGPNDPYNLVTVHQGGVVVDGGRDGTTASWPASVPNMQDDRDVTGHFGPGQGMTIPPRKQIIGFAKFRSRNEALEARDILQGRRVDIEKGAVLKAEMAKKNLHTKRGVGPVPPVSMGGGATGIGGGGMGGIVPGETLAIASGLNGPGLGMMSVSSNGAGEAMSARERELGTLGAMGLGGISQWREQRVSDGIVNREEEERERKREREAREAGVINAMGLGSGTRGPKERAEEDERERERRRKEKEGRLRSTNATAFDAFHSVPSQASSISRTNSGAVGNMLAPSENGGGVSPMGNGSIFMVQSQHDEVLTNENALPGPWDMVNTNSFRQQSNSVTNLPPRPPSSNRQPSPSLTNPSVTFSPTNDTTNLPPHPSLPIRPRMSPSAESQQQPIQPPLASQGSISQSPSSASSVNGGSQSSGDVEISKVIGGLAVSTSQGSTSPQLPSPASGSSAGGKTNTIDQNPPINTLYVGNLPTTQMPSGYPPNYLEDSLRDLFQRRPGFRKLCFRQKTNGPMCFVEFEDVAYAAKTLNELYGNSLNGLIKGGGIRLSYSKNPLGVRTPTSAGTGPSLQQQQLQGNGPQTSVSSSFPLDAFQPRSSVDMDSNRQPVMRSPPPSASFNYMSSQPPPRFFSPTPPSSAFSTSSILASTSSSAFPRSNLPAQHGYGSSVSTSTFSPFGLSTTPPNSSMALEQSITDPTDHHFSHQRDLSTSNIEAARAG